VGGELREFLDRREKLALLDADPSWVPDSIRSGRVEAIGVVRSLEARRPESAAGTVDARGGGAADSSARAAGGLASPEAMVTVTVLYDAADERSRRAEDVLSDAFGDWADTLLARRLRARGLPEAFATPLLVSDSSVARPEELGGYTLGRFLPMLLIVITILGAFYPAVDLAAGEKERGTLETLLTAPVPAGRIVAGKFITVACVGLVAAALNLGSMLLTFQAGLFRFQAAARIEFSLPASSILVILAVLVPVAVLFGSLFLGIAVRSHSFKEAQNALTPVYILAIVPAMLPAMPGIEFTPALAVMPVAGVALLFRELMAGSAEPLASLLALVSTCAYAALALVFAARAFGREDVLFGTGERAELVRGAGLRAWGARLTALGRRRAAGGVPRPPGGWGGAEEAGVAAPPPSRAARRVPLPRHVFPFVALVGTLYFYGGVAMQLRLGERGILAAEWLFLFLPVLLFVVLGDFDLGSTLGLRRPSGRQLAAALILVVGAAPVGWFIAWIQTFFLRVPFEWLEGLEKVLTAGDARRLLWLLLVMALTPAICEEVVFRGVLLGGTRSTITASGALLVNAAAFGAFHLSFESAIRFLPAAWTGLFLAWAVWRTGSIWTSVLMHFVNNGLIVIIVSTPALSRWIGTGTLAPPWYLLPLAVLALGTGARLLAGASAPDSPGYAGGSRAR
ncbi:MAG: CPBP family intramembrane metalloprotease, partial [Gemmatimonadetes bacterium]|nr:CPBP family intramembrane metalloprotease [Gemmatimonadota bacterium]